MSVQEGGGQAEAVGADNVGSKDDTSSADAPAAPKDTKTDDAAKDAAKAAKDTEPKVRHAQHFEFSGAVTFDQF